MNAQAKDVETVLRELASGGKIFSVTFRKKTDDSIRKMVCRFDVKKGVTGKGRKFEPNEKGLISVYDTQAQEPRFIYVPGIIEIKIGGEVYKFEEEVQV